MLIFTNLNQLKYKCEHYVILYELFTIKNSHIIKQPLTNHMKHETFPNHKTIQIYIIYNDIHIIYKASKTTTTQSNFPTKIKLKYCTEIVLDRFSFRKPQLSNTIQRFMCTIIALCGTGPVRGLIITFIVIL